MNNREPLGDRDDQQIQVRDHRDKDWFWANNALYEEHEDESDGKLKTFAQVIGSSAINVYMFLARLVDNRTQSCYPSYPKISARTGLSVATSITSIHKLEDHGMIKVNERLAEEGDRTSNLYTLLPVSNWVIRGGLKNRGPLKTVEKPVRLAKSKRRGTNDVPQVVQNTGDQVVQNLEDGGTNIGGYQYSRTPDSIEQDSQDQQAVVVADAIALTTGHQVTPSIETNESDIAQDLRAAGVSAAVANKLASDVPDVARQQLLYLPHRPGVKSRGAVLVKSILENWAAPDAWIEQQNRHDIEDRRRDQVERETQARRADREKAAEKSAEDAAAREEFKKLWQSLDARNQDRIDAAVKERLGILGKAGNTEGALWSMRRILFLELTGQAIRESVQGE